MARAWAEAQLIEDGFERVYIELDWYDGPRAGIADIGGRPHYFECLDYDEADEYRVWPAYGEALAWEFEQWRIFVSWNQRYRSGEIGTESHPGHGGIGSRYDELTLLLAPHRRSPSDTRTLMGEIRIDDGDRYRPEGTNVWFRWRSSDPR
ncbi:hypothetical protein [Nocardia crassostreae]|uniref:hypothetical protein n=1 Tax=Nocardia crassostreae TaxID=53428 RepID=UPI00082F81E8|nr:hypothetical protein [Nocardia crassostreae]